VSAAPAPPAAGAGAAADVIHEEEALGRAYDLRLLRRLWGWVAPYRRQVALTLGLVVPLFALELAPGLIVKGGLDRLTRSQDPQLDVRALLLVAVMLAAAGLQFWHQVLMARTGQSAMRDLRRDVFAHTLRLHMGFFDRYPVGRLVTRSTNDVENVAEMFSAGIVALVTDVFKMLGIAAALLIMHTKLALVTFTVVPLLALATSIFRLRVREAFRAVRVRIARINAYVQENVTGMKVVQLFSREARNAREFERLNADHRDAWFDSIRYDSALFSVVELASGLTVALIVWYGSGQQIEVGAFYLFIDWMRRFFLPLRDLSAKYSVMQSAMASCERIFQILDTLPAIRDPREERTSVGRGAIEFQNVWFAYRGEEWVLRDVSFRVAPGERVALVGATGAGKTSIIKLLLRLYEVNRGRILLDGVDLRELAQAELRRRVAMVLQDVFLFSGSIAENVALGRTDLAPDALLRATRAVEAHRFVERLPEGYATLVRERGTNLSAGQRQLLSFARALAHGADVLVLDEATSSIDSETEALLQHGVHVLMEGKTAIVVAHRLSTIRDCDRIHVLHRGRLVESGRHDELVAARGVYHRLYRLQYQGQEPTLARAAPG
jgi:ATP-binding cassette subfamily B protein